MDTVVILLVPAALALTAALGMALLNRVRTARRLQAALNAYAEKQIAQQSRQKTLQKARSR